MLVVDLFPYTLLAITVIDEISDDRGTHQGFLYHILPNAIAHGIEFLAMLLKQTRANILIFANIAYGYGTSH